MLKMMKVVAWSVAAHDGNIDRKKQLEQRDPEGEPCRALMDPWARGTVPTKKEVIDPFMNLSGTNSGPPSIASRQPSRAPSEAGSYQSGKSRTLGSVSTNKGGAPGRSKKDDNVPGNCYPYHNAIQTFPNHISLLMYAFILSRSLTTSHTLSSHAQSYLHTPSPLMPNHTFTHPHTLSHNLPSLLVYAFILSRSLSSSFNQSTPYPDSGTIIELDEEVFDFDATGGMFQQLQKIQRQKLKELKLRQSKAGVDEFAGTRSLPHVYT